MILNNLGSSGEFNSVDLYNIGSVFNYLQSNVKHRLAYVIKGIIKSIMKEEGGKVCVLPSCITTTVLRNYSTISSSAFYSNLAALREIGAITKVDHCWQVNMEKLHSLLAE
ncbi:hypothetical protein [Listeria ilorinensis]|uniref:hypothetical protein n=1 Tax=Listeria ilorinensis TaxID=2867439 RepID=UPI001EF6C538|nr:hypothetical protein [Listeria ilorinensis]